jgi:hypothetical protein
MGRIYTFLSNQKMRRDNKLVAEKQKKQLVESEPPKGEKQDNQVTGSDANV